VNEPYILKPYELAYGTDNIWPNSHGIEVLGCFDTVGSLGLGDTRFLSNAWSRHRFEYLNVKLSPCKCEKLASKLFLDDTQMSNMPFML